MEIRLELTACQDELQRLMSTTKDAKGGEGEKEKMIAAYGERVEAANEAVYGWFSRMWSQGKDVAGHWPVEEVRELAKRLWEDDPAMWTWLMRRTHEMQAEYRDGYKKK